VTAHETWEDSARSHVEEERPMALHRQAKAFLAGMEASGAPPLHELTPRKLALRREC
jgi:hypothetical protein